jgi:type II secretory pathway pseudopilin PulG
MKKFLAGLLVAVFTLMTIASPSSTQLHPPKDAAEAVGQLMGLVLLIAGLFYSVRWYMKLDGHTYKLARQAWASILFWYSLLAILVGLGMAVTISVAVGATMTAIWACLGFVCWKWRGRLRRAEASGAVSKGAKIGVSTGMIFVYAGIGLIALLIIAAIAIPNLLRARIAANESSAVASLRTINTAETAYASAYTTAGYAPVLTVLGGTNCAPPDEASACLIDTQLESGQKSGYRFELRNRIHSEISGDKYQVVAYPLVPNQTGVRAFCSDETAIIKFDANGSPDDCLANGSPLQ